MIPDVFRFLFLSLEPNLNAPRLLLRLNWADHVGSKHNKEEVRTEP